MQRLNLPSHCYERDASQLNLLVQHSYIFTFALNWQAKAQSCWNLWTCRWKSPRICWKWSGVLPSLPHQPCANKSCANSVVPMALINLKEMSCQQPFDLMSVKRETLNSQTTCLSLCNANTGTVVGQGGRRMANWIVLANSNRTKQPVLVADHFATITCQRRNMEGLGTKRKAIHE